MNRVTRDGYVLTAIQFLRICNGTLMLIAIPMLLSDLGFSFAKIGIIWGLCSLGFAVTSLYLGKLSQVVGRKGIYVLGFVIATLGKPLYLLVNSLATFAAVRIFDQSGRVVGDSVQDSIRADLFPPEHRPKLMAQIFIGFSAGRLFGAFAGMFLIAYFTHTYAFYASMVFLGTGALLAAIFIKDVPKKETDKFKFTLSWKNYSPDFKKMAIFEGLETFRWTLFYPFFWLFLSQSVGASKVDMYGLLCLSNIFGAGIAWLNRSRIQTRGLVTTAAVIILIDAVFLLLLTQVDTLSEFGPIASALPHILPAAFLATPALGIFAVIYIILDFNTVVRKPATISLGMNAASEENRGEEMAFLRTIGILMSMAGAPIAGLLAQYVSPVAPFVVCALCKIGQAWVLRSLSPEASQDQLVEAVS